MSSYRSSSDICPVAFPPSFTRWSVCRATSADNVLVCALGALKKQELTKATWAVCPHPMVCHTEGANKTLCAASPTK